MSWQSHAKNQHGELSPASSDDPQLSVASISESVFCPRAGILTLESRADERAEEPAFDLTAIYELQVLEAAIVRTIWLLVVGVVGAVVLVYVTNSLAQRFHEFFWILSLGFAVRLLTFMGRQVIRLLNLLERRKSAQQAHCVEPDPHSIELQDVTWWGLLNLGFESVKYTQALVDSESKIAGKPWRVLRNGSLRIPAFRTRSVGDLPSQQNIAKIIAYCHLLETCEGFESPYGIVLMGDTYRGFAVPNRGTFRAIFVNAVKQFRKVASDAERTRRDPLPPNQRKKCSDCPFGEPRLVNLGKPTVLNDHRIEPHVLRKWTKRFHCDCGDRFRWKPHHKENESLREA